MASATYFVVVPFVRGDDGALHPGEAFEVRSADAARWRAEALACAHAGVVAFSRAGDPATGLFENAVVLSQLGEVDLDALNE